MQDIRPNFPKTSITTYTCPNCQVLQGHISENQDTIRCLNEKIDQATRQLNMFQTQNAGKESGTSNKQSSIYEIGDEAPCYQIKELLEKLQDAKTKADHRAQLLHHVMDEYNVMLKEYDILKSELSILASRNDNMKKSFEMQNINIQELQKTAKNLELENNLLRQTRIIDVPYKKWYDICDHSCNVHPRHALRRSSHINRDPRSTQHAGCESCLRAEVWAEKMATQSGNKEDVFEPGSHTFSPRGEFVSTEAFSSMDNEPNPHYSAYKTIIPNKYLSHEETKSNK